MDDSFMLKDVQISYPHLFEKANFNGVEGKYSAKFIIKNDSENMKLILEKIKELFSEHEKISPERTCFRADKQNTGDFIFSASNNSRPLVLDRKKNAITKDDELILAGIYVNGLVSLWWQDNKFGKRLNANLHAVQFFRDTGERFSTAERLVDPELKFESYEDSPDDDFDNLWN